MYQPFNQVSNKANGGTIGNFETLHDGLHNVFGLGHMGIVEVSAFDPVFWFHHANMDRIIARKFIPNEPKLFRLIPYSISIQVPRHMG
jgi:hypothetical protein